MVALIVVRIAELQNCTSVWLYCCQKSVVIKKKKKRAFPPNFLPKARERKNKRSARKKVVKRRIVFKEIKEIKGGEQRSLFMGEIRE